MELCKKCKFLHVLPKPDRRIVWSWHSENGTVFKVPRNDSLSTDDCFVELINILVAAITLLVAAGLIFKYKCSGGRKTSKTLLPFHSSRTVLCIVLSSTLLLELCETLLTTISLSTVLTILAVLTCWILHWETEIKDGFGTAATGGGFTIIGLSRAWKILYLYRFGLTVEHVRMVATSISTICCGLLAVLDSYTLYRMMQKSKRYTIRQLENTQTSYRHSTSPFLSKITFHWVTDLLSRGYRAPLEARDLGELPEEETTKNQFNRFRRIYEVERQKKKLSLWRCFWKRIWPSFAIGGILKLFGDATTLIGPTAIPRIIDYVSVSQNGTHDRLPNIALTFNQIMENGYFLGLVVFLAALLQSTLSQVSTHILCVEGIRLRTALQALIYDKALRLCSWSIVEEEKPLDKEKDQSRHQQVADIGTLTNLMAEDAYNVMSFFWIGHYIWAIPLKITAIIFLLYTKLGISAIVGAVCCILIVSPIQLILGKKMSENSKSIAEKSDSRLQLVNETLQGIRLVKLRAWESIFENRIRKARKEELKTLDKDSMYWALINFLTHVSSVLTTLFTFGIYFWLEGRNLDAGSVFASLALFSQLTVPLCIFPVIVPIIINAMVSTTRLEEFLRLPEIINILPEVADRRLDVPDDFIPKTFTMSSQTEAINVHSITTFGSLDNIEEGEEDQQSHGLREFDLNSSVETVFEKDPEIPETVLRMKSGTFSWGSEENQLVIRDLSFPRGQLTLIIGRTGSGKTSLLLAMLGEIQKTRGEIEWSKGLKIAYVAQKPWLLNATLRDNILFGSAYQPRRYRSVLRACALQPDVDILPGRDLTRIGEKGINLSGGQKQRVAIARALYSDADVVIMDDPLSALDQQVGQQIFNHGVRRLLLRSGRTVIMVTHRQELLSTAHQVVVMDNCKVRITGTKSSIEDLDPELANEWRRVTTKREEEGRVHKTAKDRWSLIRLVSRIGINVRNRHGSDGSWITDQDAHVNPHVFVPLRKRRTTLAGSRYLAHDLTDLPVPTEEWNVIKKRTRTHRNAVRSSSLQPQRRPPPVLRHSSTPTILESRYTVPRKRNNTFDSVQPSALKHLFSSRNIENSEGASLHRDRSVLRKLMSSNSTQSQERERPIKRLVSVDSKGTEIDEIEENFDSEEHQTGDYEKGPREAVPTMSWTEYPKAGGLVPGITYVGAALICQAVRVYTDLWLSRWTEQSNQFFINEHQDAMLYFTVYIALSVGSILLSFIYNAAGQWAGARARRKLHQQAVSALLRVPISFFECNPIGKILNRFSADMGVIDKKISTSIQRLTSFVLLCASAMLVNVTVSPWFLIPAVPTCAAYYFLQRFYRRSARQLQRLDGSTRGPVGAHFSETLCGLPTLRAFKQEDRFMEEVMKYLDVNTNAFLILNTSSRWLGIALDYLGAVIVLTAIFAALISAELYPTHVTPALVGLGINYTLLVPIYLNWVVKFTAEIEMYMGSVARVSAYVNARQENYHTDCEVTDSNWPDTGELVFENVSLRYDSQRDPVISNFSLRIPGGQKVGICGRTGSGKSSIVMGLFRFVEAAEGRVLLDKIDVRTIPLQTVRSRMSAIPQDVIMFSGTIRENLDPLSEHQDQDLWDALEIAQMKDVISSHPEGLSLEVREGGENFSIGQLQLLCMARAVLQQASVVVLDEATSALDATTEKTLLKAVSMAFRDTTVITIAHRPAALLNCDRILVLDEGKIVEDGSPATLMQRQNGFLSDMLKATEYNDDSKS